MAIPANDVQDLRQPTGVGMMDCKKDRPTAAGNMGREL